MPRNKYPMVTAGVPSGGAGVGLAGLGAAAMSKKWKGTDADDFLGTPDFDKSRSEKWEKAAKKGWDLDLVDKHMEESGTLDLAKAQRYVKDHSDDSGKRQKGLKKMFYEWGKFQRRFWEKTGKMPGE